MTARTTHRLLAAGVCLLMAGGLSAADDAFAPPPPSSPGPGQTPSTQRPSPHFFPGRILQSKAAVVEPPAPVPTSDQLPPTSDTGPLTSDLRPPISDLRLLEERPALETRASPH